jgi:hypothetical protein
MMRAISGDRNDTHITLADERLVMAEDGRGSEYLRRASGLSWLTTSCVVATASGRSEGRKDYPSVATIQKLLD